MSESVETKTENKTNNVSVLDNVLFIVIVVFVIAFFVWFIVFNVKSYKADMSAAEIVKEQRIAASELVREFVENKSVVDVECERYMFVHQDDVYDFTVTVEDSDGHSETKTFIAYPYVVLDSTDTFWHIDITKDGRIKIYEPKVYISK